MSYPTLSMVRVCLPPLYGSCLPPIFTPSPTSILSFQNMIEFQLQRETPSSTMGFGFFGAGVGSLFVEYFQFCFPLEAPVRIVMAHTANMRAQRKMSERKHTPQRSRGPENFLRWQAMLVVEVCLARRQTRMKGHQEVNAHPPNMQVELYG